MELLTLGPAGTYSHRAATTLAADTVSFASSVTAIVAAVADEKARRGLVPVENSIEGAVTETLDAFVEHEIAIRQELIVPIQHALLAHNESFTEIASHPQALAQCRSYLDRAYPDAERTAVASTADGIQRAREDDDVAAIGHPANADNTLQTLATDIQDGTANDTRFLLLAPEAERQQTGTKSSLIVYPNSNYPGLLMALLEPFAQREINLTRIESRPSGKALGDYLFHIDIAASLDERRTVDALAEIETVIEDGWIRRLGSYDSETIETDRSSG